jgi:Tol biopolymer transport system component
VSDASACARGGFGPAEPIDTGALDAWAPSLSVDGRTLLFAGAEPFEPERIFVASRGAGGRSPFGRATPLDGVDSGSGEGSPLLSVDELTLYFYSNRPGGAGGRDLWQATRSDTRASFTDATPLIALASAGVEHLPWLSADELTLLFVSTRAGGMGQSDIWVATRPALDAELGGVRPLDGVNTSSDEGRAVLTRDGLTVIFASARELGLGQHDLWLATRPDPAAAFGEPSNLSELNSEGLDLDPFLSADEQELYFASNRRGRAELWRAPWLCRD